MSVLIPHFDLPFKLDSSGHAVVVDQDTLDDVSNCVEAVLRTVLGQRQELQDFGLAELTLQNQPLDTGTIIQQVLEQEPRAVLLIDQAPDQFDSLVARVLVQVSTREG